MSLSLNSYLPKSATSRSLTMPFSDLKNQDAANIEPALISVFRMVVGLQLAISATMVPFVLSYKPDSDWLLWFGIWSVVCTALIFVYLSVPVLQRVLGSYYLPIALIANILVQVAPRVAMLFADPMLLSEQFAASDAIAYGWRMMPPLFFTLIFIAWRYRFRVALLFTAMMTGLSVGIAIYDYLNGNTNWPELLEQSLFSGVFFIVVGYVVSQLVGAQKEKENQLSEANAQIVDHAATIEQLAVSRERNRLARELHDTLAHTLSAVTVQLAAIDSALEHSPDRARNMVDKTLSNARSGLDETRRALRDLRASPLDDLGLELAIRTQAEAIASRSGLKLELDLLTNRSLSAEDEQNIYRLVQEALENVARHANAQTLRVTLNTLDPIKVVEVADDGRGFEVDTLTQNGRYGFQGMEERANLVGGTLSIESAPNQGTTVRLEVDAE